MITIDSHWPEGDWRNSYFVPENLRECVPRAEALRSLVPEESTMAEMALGFILSNPDIATTIPGMRRPEHVRANLAQSDAAPLPEHLLQRLRAHRWDREPTEWSQ
jgi:aryl-alcohol dehydrogenase-like predicted oxidoreductase